MSTSLLVRQQAERWFTPTQAADVITALDTADLSFGHVSPDRVHLALLLISRGDFQRFREALRQASQDWRDTLVTAGLANEDWPQILKLEGIEFTT